MHMAMTTRLLVDLNRSPWHPHLFSEITRPLSESRRREILQRYYVPYRGKADGFTTYLRRCYAADSTDPQLIRPRPKTVVFASERGKLYSAKSETPLSGFVSAA